MGWAVGLGAVALLAATAIAMGGYTAALRRLELQKWRELQERARLVSLALAGEAEASEAEALACLEEAWRGPGAHLPADEYLCIVDGEARLILHTAHPGRRADDTGGRPSLAKGEGGPESLSDLAAAFDDGSAHAGEYVSSAGERHLVAFHPVASRGWMLGLCRSAEALTQEVQSGVRLVAISFVAVLAVVIPTFLTILHRVTVASQEEARRAEEALLRSSRLIALGEMAAGMAHELNQPLTVISTMAEGVEIRRQAGIDMEPEHVEMWSREILAAVERMRRLVTHLRTFSRDHSQEPRQSLSLNTVVEGAQSMTQTQLRSRGIHVKVDLDQELPPALGDRYGLEQVVINLLHNARDAVEARGRQLSGQSGAGLQMQIEVVTRSQDLGPVLEVRDNGAGMDEATQERVFEPFFTTKGPGEGTGLGLSIAHGIVRAHGGILECDSVLGRGATFRVKLPPAPVAGEPGRPPPDVAPSTVS